MLARKINGVWDIWDGDPFEHPLHPEWGPKWKISPNAEDFWSAEKLLEAGLCKVTVVQPSINPATEVLTGPVYTQDATSMTATWTKRNKTAPEIDAEKTSAVNALDGSRNAQWELLLLIANDLRTIKNRLNQLIDATNQAGTVNKFAAGQVTQIADIAALKGIVKNLLP